VKKVQYFTDKKVKRETRFEKSEKVGYWDISLNGEIIGSIQRKPQFGYTNYKLFDKHDKYIGMAATRVEAKLLVAYDFLKDENILIK
jgi:hypothetical protein